jgi:hypothetical protein
MILIFVVTLTLLIEETVAISDRRIFLEEIEWECVEPGTISCQKVIGTCKVSVT